MPFLRKGECGEGVSQKFDIAAASCDPPGCRRQHYDEWISSKAFERVH